MARWEKITAALGPAVIGVAASVAGTLVSIWYTNQKAAEHEAKEEKKAAEREAKEARAKQETLRLAKELEFATRIRPLSDKAKDVCRNWTGTSCDTAANMRQFLQEYALRYAAKKYPDKVSSSLRPTTSKMAADLDALHDFRRQTLGFWKRCIDEGIIDSVEFPGPGDRLSFLTFHWGLYLGNNICTNPCKDDAVIPRVQPPQLDPEYEAVMRGLRTRAPKLAEQASQYHAELAPQFQEIHDKIFVR